MNEKLIVKSFGPIRDIDITFKSINIFVGDQGSGKSCVAKLFSMFKWLEKELAMQRQKKTYYEQYNRFSTMLCKYHRIESFIRKETYIKYDGYKYVFEYRNSRFHVSDKKKELKFIPKIMYIPAERMILSVAENKSRLLKELPNSCDDFQSEFSDAKKNYKSGYDLPFGGLHYEYDSLNDISKISGKGYDEHPVKLTHASSGIQSALPLCLVSEYLSDKVLNQEETKLSKEERIKIEKQVVDIMNNINYTENIKEMMLKQISSLNRYGCFINITEEPELNLYPKSQMGVLMSLVKDNAKSMDNQLLITTHSPYTLAIFNLLIMANKIYLEGGKDIKAQVEEIIPRSYHIDENNIAAYSLTPENEQSYRSVINHKTGMIDRNDLDSVSITISNKFNTLYRLYGLTSKK